MNADKADPLANYRRYAMTLSLAHDLTGDALARYWKWLEDAVLVPFRDQYQDEYPKFLNEIQDVLSEAGNRGVTMAVQHD